MQQSEFGSVKPSAGCMTLVLTIIKVESSPFLCFQGLSKVECREITLERGFFWAHDQLWEVKQYWVEIKA